MVCIGWCFFLFVVVLRVEVVAWIVLTWSFLPLLVLRSEALFGWNGAQAELALRLHGSALLGHWHLIGIPHLSDTLEDLLFLLIDDLHFFEVLKPLDILLTQLIHIYLLSLFLLLSHWLNL